MEIKVSGLHEVRGRADLALGCMILKSGAMDLALSLDDARIAKGITCSGAFKDRNVVQELIDAGKVFNNILNGVMDGDIQIG